MVLSTKSGISIDDPTMPSSMVCCPYLSPASTLIGDTVSDPAVPARAGLPPLSLLSLFLSSAHQGC